MTFLEAATSSQYGCAKRFERRPIREIRKQLRGDLTIEFFDEDNWMYIPGWYPEANDHYKDWESL